MTKAISSNIGYPRIGEKREWKRALEKFWNGQSTEEELLTETRNLRLKDLEKQQDLGVDLIAVGDHSLYDHVLDTSVMFGVIPERYGYKGGEVDLATYFAMARGGKETIASEMTKWFNTNYHYMVPELNDITPTVTTNRPLAFYKEAKEKLGIDGKPVVLGPVTYLKLSKGYEEKDFQQLLTTFTTLYIQVLKELEEAGVTWVQIDEPILVTELSADDLEAARKAYEEIQNAVPKLKIILQTYFERVNDYKKVVEFPVEAIGLDFIHGDSLSLIKEHGFPQDKVLAAGIVDGRNVWRADLTAQFSLLEEIEKHVESSRIIVQPSSSLLHVPVTKASETEIDPVILGGISFADEKLQEIVTLTKGLQDGKAAIQKELDVTANELNLLNKSAYRTNKKVKESLETLTDADANRTSTFETRLAKQRERFNLPLLPTTTIGSLPQTSEVRQTRTKWRKEEITNEAYEQFIEESIKKWIAIQEEIDIDVLVHGEFERTDMVEYFGEKLNGFGVTRFGWVQSYGSRCVKPPLIFGDVSFEKPMTLKESVYAQSLTDRPVKGMLTGPVTILNWSFVHDDVPRFTVLNQIALALREEIEVLEENGIKIIQVDEPALREGLPLANDKKQAYLDASVYAFKLATASVEDDTQIHTHMCYSDFNDIFDTIDGLDADVISIETSRSHGELVSTFEENTYEKEIGLGVYDIHSPRIPSESEIEQNITRALATISPQQFWINPDCGLKTRKEDETIDALKVMVQAAKKVRESKLITAK